MCLHLSATVAAVVVSVPDCVYIDGRCSPVVCTSLVQLCAQWFSDAFSGPAECTSLKVQVHIPMSCQNYAAGIGSGVPFFSTRRHVSADVQLTRPAEFVCTCAKVLC